MMQKLVGQVTYFMGAMVLAVMVGCASTAKREGTGEYVDDSAITAKVKAAILGDPALKVFQVNVETFKGVVQLSGFVDSPAMASKAADVARSVTRHERAEMRPPKSLFVCAL